MRLLVTGACGLLGSAIVREFGDCDVHPFSHGQLDVADESAVAAAMDAVVPDVIVNCASFNDDDRAEGEPEDSMRANANGVLPLARAAGTHGAVLVHYSTDFVFDGETDRPYVEEDSPSPRSVYGTSKLLGDWFAAEAPRGYVLRVESLFGAPGPAAGRRGSLGNIVERIRASEEVPVFVDRTVSPSYTADVARATRAVVERALPPGLYHCVNEGYATWAEIAGEAARLLGVGWRMKRLTLQTAGLRAQRPRFCAMSPAKLAQHGVVMPTWDDALQRYLIG
jgi:dTDP-4-dehydrorhamnose reductase